MATDLLARAAAYAELAAKKREQSAAILAKVQAELQAKREEGRNKINLRLPANLSKDVETGQPTLVAPVKIEMTAKQLEAIEMAKEGASFCLIGAAGTGKTTTVKQLVQTLIDLNLLPPLRESSKHLFAGTPAIAFCAFTNRAVNNIKRQLPANLKRHAKTIHKLLEFQPVYEGDMLTGKKKMRFEETRNALNPLPALKYIVVEESSMVGTELFAKLKAAAPTAKFIFLGDLYQLPPIYDSGILGFKLNELPVIELDKVWRQGKDSGIITLAHAIKDGNQLSQAKLQEIASLRGDIQLRPWPKKVPSATISRAFAKHISESLCKEFDPFSDIMLCPLVKNFGSAEINKAFAQTFGDLRDATVFEIVAGIRKHYLAVGDKVMFEKEDYKIVNITRNLEYLGQPARHESRHLDRWGHYSGALADISMDSAEADMDAAFAALGNINLDNADEDDTVNKASHIVELEPLFWDADSEKPANVILSTAGEFNSIDFSYCISVHKSQGSEWRKVYFVLHHSHSNMLTREMLYTGVTRAREELVLYYDKESLPMGTDGTFQKGVANVVIKGKTLAEKAEYFKGKKEFAQKKFDLNSLF